MIVIIGIISNMYRLLNTRNATTIDLTEKELVNLMKSNKIVIYNAKLDKNNKIVGTQGKFTRFKSNTYKPLVILFEMIKYNKIIGYTVSDINGNIIRASVDEIIRVGQKIGIQNGKIEYCGSSKKIEPIHGEFCKIIIK